MLKNKDGGNMKRIIILSLAFLFIAELGIAQRAEGKITFNRKVNWITIMSEMPYMTSEEIDRNKLTWGNWENEGTDYDYYFKDGKSVYTVQEKEENTGAQYSWKQEKFYIIRDHNKKSKEDFVETLGKKYIIKDDIAKRKWKILNEIKEISGYLCMKAETYDEIKKQTIHAWFTDQIDFYGGPEGFDGLPGMILELNVNDGASIISATKVDFETAVEKLPKPKKMKGKEIQTEEFDQMISKFIAEYIEGEKNPYWRVRY